MDENKYLSIIVAVFEELETMTELTIETKRKKFQEVILKKFSEEEQTKLITMKDFIDNCNKEVSQLKFHITDYIELIKRGKLSKTIAEINFGLRDKDLIRKEEIKSDGNTNLIRKKEIESETDAVNKLFGKNYLVDVHSIEKNAKNQMCLRDIEFIESVFETINSIKPQQPEFLDIPKTSAIEKIIYLNELGVIDFLKNDPNFKTSVSLMANYLSHITGEKYGTLQPILNSFINEDLENKNHPYKSNTTVEKVRQTLVNKKIKTS